MLAAVRTVKYKCGVCDTAVSRKKVSPTRYVIVVVVFVSVVVVVEVVVVFVVFGVVVTFVIYRRCSWCPR